MTTPARRHFAAACAAKQGDDIDLSKMTPYNMLFIKMKQDQAILGGIQSVQAKATVKAEMLPKYQDWMLGCLKAQAVSKQDAIYPTILIWTIDAGQLNNATALGLLAIKLNVVLADEYKRDLKTVVIEQITEMMTAGADISAKNLELLTGLMDAKNDNGTFQVDMHDRIRAKFFRAGGEWHEAQGSKAPIQRIADSTPTTNIRLSKSEN